MSEAYELVSAARPQRANVLGVGISVIDLESALRHACVALETKTKGYVCVTGVHGVSEAQEDAGFRSILNNAWLNTPDGMPMVWMGRLQGFRDIGRVYGPDLMLRLCEVSASRGYTHFLYGGRPGVAQELKQRLEKRFPGLNIVGTWTPPFRPLTAKEEAELRSHVGSLKPDIFWVGLSTPKQERFMASHWHGLDSTLFIGVGAAFDFHTGQVRQAPRWMQRSGLEWFFRLTCEPRRLWKRYLKNNPLFVIRAVSQLARLRKYPLD
jgi:N-acetylglucosaminyldiphosphoundecaprenol N-acetyl-beta-D-mannosaminyltransferase